MIWDQLTSEELGQLDRNIPVVIPIAATEQHGAHLPLATDRLIGEHFLKELDREIPEKVLIVPTISVGCSDHHMSFQGTLTLSHQTFVAQVKGFLESLIHHGFNTMILFNSHGGNQAVGQVIVEEMGYKHQQKQILMVTWWGLVIQQLQTITTTGFGGTGHAGEFETSLMMLIAPSLVRASKIQPGMNRNTLNWAQGDMLQAPKASYYRTMEEMTPNGIFGDPTAASVEKGVRITRVVVDGLHQLIRDLQSPTK